LLKRSILGAALVAASCQPAADPAFALRGSWQVVAHHCPADCALSEDEAVRWHGTRAEYGPDRARFGDEVCGAPGYRSSSMTAAQFAEGLVVQPGELGIAGEPIHAVEVTCEGQDWLAPGSLLIVKGDGGLLAHWDGAFFELARSDR
jgi:hypothetical protein